MQCGICERDASQACCTGCARHTAWPFRYEILLRISEKSSLEAQVNKFLEISLDQNSLQDDTARYRKCKLQRTQTQECRHWTAEIKQETVKVKSDIEKLRERISVLRDQNKRRKPPFDEASRGLEDKRNLMLDSIQRETRRTRQKWNAVLNRTVEARIYLCREAASLCGLRIQKRRKGTLDFVIGRVVIPTLHDLNNHHPVTITAAFWNLSHLLMLVAHYLSLRLPYQIFLPQRDSPFTYIKGHNNTRQRPLHLTRPLAEMSREDTKTYNLFLEGVTMLAYNVAWVCYTQGLVIMDIEEAMKPGYNLWRLLVAGHGGMETGKFGRWSHGSAGAFLWGREGSDMLREYRLSAAAVLEKLQVILMGENLGLEWDLVEEVSEELGNGRDSRLTEIDFAEWTKVSGRKHR